MYRSAYSHLDTPSLLIDERIMLKNMHDMQQKANDSNVNLRPHTKTHKMPELARLQVQAGASGIAVAKVGEAEVMAEHGLNDIFIANEVVGLSKVERIRNLNKGINISLGVDNTYQVDQLESVFSLEQKPIEVLIELEVGENRSGVISDEQLVHLAKYIESKVNVKLKGVFSHEGHTYSARDIDHCIALAKASQKRTVRAAEIIRSLGIDIQTVSIGATPSLMQTGLMPGITEIRPGTYLLMDAGQANALNGFERCAATVLATVISKPTEERVILDTGAKALTAQKRGEGICHTPGNGVVKGPGLVRLSAVFDEHGIIYDRNFRERIEVGDKIEVIPNHICPTCNLYDMAYLVSGGEVLKEIPILARGRLT